MTQEEPEERPVALPDGVSVRPLDTVDQVFQACEVLAAVWNGDRSGVPPNLLRALAHSGNYAVGLYDAERMIGASVAFFGEPSAQTMHSHVTGVLPEHRSRGLGRLLKLHQRQWAFERGVQRITWTFDPLVARNAHFNVRVLGVRVTDYLVDHYGPMDDGVNRGDETDRLLASWSLTAPERPPAEEEVVTTVEVPRDIEGMRSTAPAEAAEWRYRVRDAFQGLLADGLRMAGFDERGYLFTRG